MIFVFGVLIGAVAILLVGYAVLRIAVTEAVGRGFGW